MVLCAIIGHERSSRQRNTDPGVLHMPYGIRLTAYADPPATLTSSGYITGLRMPLSTIDRWLNNGETGPTLGPVRFVEVFVD